MMSKVIFSLERVYLHWNRQNLIFFLGLYLSLILIQTFLKNQDSSWVYFLHNIWFIFSTWYNMIYFSETWYIFYFIFIICLGTHWQFEPSVSSSLLSLVSVWSTPSLLSSSPPPPHTSSLSTSQHQQCILSWILSSQNMQTSW